MKYKQFIFLLFLLLVACSPHPSEEGSSVINPVPLPTESPAQTSTPKEIPTQLSTLAFEEKQTESARIINATLTARAEMITEIFALTPSPTPSPTRTPRPTSTPTPIPPTIPIATVSARATIETLQDVCLEFGIDSSRDAKISPDGEWAAISCGYKRDQVFIVQNQKDLRWVFNFAEFLNPELEGIPGNFAPFAWSSDGRFLYFTKYLGWSGGGNQCFSGIGVFGLFRLHLTTGTLVTLVPTDDYFNGNKIRFSPTVEYYAVDLNGIRITNLETDEVTQIDVSGVMDMRWSPDGRYLAYSTASCGEEFVESSSIFVWDSLTGQTQELLSSEEMRLLPSAWIDDATLRFDGEQWVENKYHYTIFEYDLTQNGMIFSGTVTPYP